MQKSQAVSRLLGPVLVIAQRSLE